MAEYTARRTMRPFSIWVTGLPGQREDEPCAVRVGVTFWANTEGPLLLLPQLWLQTSWDGDALGVVTL